MESNMNLIDIIASDIDYFKKIFIYIENILIMNSPSTLINQTKNVIDTLKQKDEKIKKEIAYFFKKALSESVYKESSLLLRYILKNVYNIDYSNINDLNIISSAFDNMEDSKLTFFSDDNEMELNIDNIINKKDEKTKKTQGNFFDNYTTTYDFNKEETLSLFNSIINEKNKISKLDTTIIPFPEYEKIFNRTCEEILNDETVHLTLPERLYLGIIASNSIGSDFLTKELIQKFLINDGNPNWIIEGLNAAPEEFKNISKINNILNLQPWLLNINDLNESGFSSKIEKFIQICIILIYFGRLANIILSFQFVVQNPEEIINKKNVNYHQIKKKSNNMYKIYKELKQSDNSKERREIQTQLKHLYIQEKKTKNKEENKTNINKKNNEFQIYKKLSNDFCSEYQDFDYHQYEFISNYEYDYDTNIFYQLQDYWPTVMNLMKEDFNYIYDLTSYCLGNGEKLPSVEYFRRAIVTYVEKLFGFFDETYDYSKTNKLLIISLKDCIKKSVCVPQYINYDFVYSNDFNIPDLTHTILITTAVKMKVQLSYLAILLINYKKEKND